MISDLMEILGLSRSDAERLYDNNNDYDYDYEEDF